VNPFPLTGAVKKIDRGEGKFRAPGKKFGEKLEISLRLDSSIISLIFSFKMF
jgi:hypothetical protein